VKQNQVHATPPRKMGRDKTVAEEYVKIRLFSLLNQVRSAAKNSSVV